MNRIFSLSILDNRWTQNRIRSLAGILVVLFAVSVADKALALQLPCCNGDHKVKFVEVQKLKTIWEYPNGWGPFPFGKSIQLQTDLVVPTYPWKHDPLPSFNHVDVPPLFELGNSLVEIQLEITEVIRAATGLPEPNLPPLEIFNNDQVTIKGTFTHLGGDLIGVYTGTLYVNGIFGNADTRAYFTQGQSFNISYQFTFKTPGINGTEIIQPNISDDGRYNLLEMLAHGHSDWGNDESLSVTAIYKCDMLGCGGPGVCTFPDPDPPQCPNCGRCIVGGETLQGQPAELSIHGNFIDAALGSNPAPGCSSCGGGGGEASTAVPNLLSIGRRMVPANQVSIGNSSPGMFFEDFDMRLTLHDEPNDNHCAILFDPRTQKSVGFEDTGGSGTYQPEYITYFYPLEVKNSSGQPASGPDVAATAYVTSHDGWRYDFDIVATELTTDEYGGRLSKITSPDGFEKSFTYKTFTQTEIDSSPTRQFQIDTVTDPAGNVATMTYNSSQQASRWAISDININSGMIQLQYLFNTSGHLETVKRKDSPATTYETISTYTYGLDTSWNAAYIQLDERLWESDQANDRIFLAQDYLSWGGTMVNQFANSLLGRADGAGVRYMVVARSETIPGLYRVEYRGKLAELQSGTYWRYFTSWSNSGGAFGEYTGTLESAYRVHPTATEDQIMQATPPLVIDETGFGFDAEYDSDLNTYRKIYGRDGGGQPDDYEQWLYDSKNRETYARDRAGFVTLTERDSDGHVVRVAIGFKDLDGDGTSTTETGATQTIYGYYPSSHQNEGLLKWTATNAYASGAVAEPAANARTDFVYNTSQQLVEAIKPLPEGETTRPSVTYIWTDGKLYSNTNETGQTTSYSYDSIGRAIETAYGDGSNEQIWRDETNNIVYQKDRNGIVSRTERDVVGRVTNTYSPYGHDTDISDSSIATVHAANLQSKSTRSYVVGRVSPFRVLSDGVGSETDYDYRGRSVVTRNNSVGTSKFTTRTVTYVANMLFSETESFTGYSRTTYNGYSADRFTVRKIMTRDPSVTFANNAAVLAATRATGADPAHVIADAVRDLQGNLVQVIDGYGTIAMNTFDALGRQTQTVQGHGTSLALTSTTTYDSFGRQWKSTDPAGMVSETLYDDAGNVKTRTVGHGTSSALATNYTYDARSRNKTTTSPSGGVSTSYFDDCCGNISGSKGHFGEGSVRVADAEGRTVYQASVKDFDFVAGNYVDPPTAETTGESTSRYLDDGRVQFTTRWKSARGQIDPQSPPIAGMNGVAVADGVTTQYVYFKEISNTASQLINRLGGGTATININAAIAKLKLAPASGGASVTFTSGSGGGWGGGEEGGGGSGTYALGRATVAIAPDEKTMQVSISDGLGRNVMNATMSGPAATTPYLLLHWGCTQFDQTYTLSGYGNTVRTNQVDPAGKWTSSMTDGFGWGVASMDEDSNLSRNKHDSAGNVLEQIDPLSHSVTHVYDALGRRTSTTSFAGTTSTSYNSSTGRVVSQTDAKSNTTSFTYDILGRQTVVTDRLGETTTRVYDSAGRLSTLTDAESKTTTYTYDALDRKLTTTYPDSSVTTIDYDPSGTFPTGSTAHKLTFDTDKSKTSISSFDGTLDKLEYRNSGGTLVGTDDFSYDALLRQSGSTSMNGITRAMTYTDRSQLASEATTYGGQTYTVSYTFDARGRIQDITYPSTRKANYSYTTRSEIDKIKWANTQFEDRAYDTAGRLTGVDRVYTDESRTYDNGNRLLTINNTNVGQVTYTWDANSNKLGETWSGAMANWSFTTQKTGGTYVDGYDQEDRFRRFIRSGQSEDIYLARSDIGNISDVEINSTSHLRSYSSAHELTSVDSTSQTFDDDGNLTAHHSGVTLGWDTANRMTQTVVPSSPTMGIEGTNDYGYDADGKRTWKKVTRNSVVVENTVYIYAGPNCVAEYNYGGATNAPVMEYIYAGDIDSLAMIARNNNAQKLIATRNQQWSIVSLNDNANGNVLERYTYDQFGKRKILAPDGSTVRTSSSYDNPYGYTSRRHDAESGLMYFRARYYDVTTGEFTSRDPMEYVDGMSLMRGYFDLWGLDSTGTCTASKCVADCQSLPTKPLYDNFQQSPRAVCVKKCHEILQKLKDWYENEKDITWLDGLSDPKFQCPCFLEKSICITYAGPGKRIEGEVINIPGGWDTDLAVDIPIGPLVWHGIWTFHPGAYHCIRSSNSGYPAQQCCYDRNLRLITYGLGAGTPDRGPNHDADDVQPWFWAKALGCMRWYLERRPPNNGLHCLPNGTLQGLDPRQQSPCLRTVVIPY